MKTLTVLCISGSLKSTSSNTRLLQALAPLLPVDVTYHIYHGLDELPHFNPDMEEGNQAVARFKDAINKADAVIISTPEYAFGVPGVLKNALDWTVHTGNLNEKPVMAVSCSPLYDGGNKAMASLLLTLGALGVKLGTKGSMSIGDIYKKLNSDSVLTDDAVLVELKEMISCLLQLTEATK